MKKNIITIVTTITIIVIGVFGYNYWINTPQYSLLQIQKSVDTKDRFLFDKYVDTNGIIKEVVEDLSKIFIEEMDTQGSAELYFFDPQILATGLVSLFKPAIENAIERGFDEFWEDEVETIESRAELKNIIESFEICYI